MKIAMGWYPYELNDMTVAHCLSLLAWYWVLELENYVSIILLYFSTLRNRLITIVNHILSYVLSPARCIVGWE
jgi:hypothetical protein